MGILVPGILSTPFLLELQRFVVTPLIQQDVKIHDWLQLGNENLLQSVDMFSIPLDPIFMHELFVYLTFH